MSGIHLFRRIRPLVEGVPVAAESFRTLRNIWRRSRLVPFDVPHGFRMVGDRAYETGSYEPAETRFVLDSLERCDVLIDVGANVGFFTCLARSRGKRVVAVEPLSSNLELLYENVALNGWSDVEVFPLAIGSAPAVAELYGESTGASLTRGWADASLRHKRYVAVSTLDILIGQRFPDVRLFIKMDVEGWELPALEGAQNVLRRSPAPVWLVENALGHHAPADERAGSFRRVFEMFWSAGYRAHPVGKPDAHVSESQVQGWVQAGATDGGVYSFVFTR